MHRRTMILIVFLGFSVGGIILARLSDQTTAGYVIAVLAAAIGLAQFLWSITTQDSRVNAGRTEITAKDVKDAHVLGEDVSGLESMPERDINIELGDVKGGSVTGAKFTGKSD